MWAKVLYNFEENSQVVIFRDKAFLKLSVEHIVANKNINKYIEK
jgi:hypothetical protein